MNAVRECETVTRAIALWGSAVAAIMFGLAFVTDVRLSYEIVSGQIVSIVLTLFVFLGYLLAWRQKYEATGSLIAVAGVAALYVWFYTAYSIIPAPALLAVALPAVFHLIAVRFHRLADNLQDKVSVEPTQAA